MKLFRRKVRVAVNGVDVSALRISFKVERTIRREPNSLEIKIYNLSLQTRQWIQDTARSRALALPLTPGIVRPRKLVFVELEAGYEEGMNRLFYGDVFIVRDRVEGADVITTVLASDGGSRTRVARVNRSFRRGTTPQQILDHLIEALGVQPGNAREVFRGVRLGNLSMYATGTVLSGSAVYEMDRFCDSAGLEWSVVDGALQLTHVRRGLSDAAVDLNPNTGLIGSPIRESLRVIKGKCFIQPDVTPGRMITVHSAEVNGDRLRVYRTTHEGDTHGPNWYINWEARPPVPPFAQRELPP